MSGGGVERWTNTLWDGGHGFPGILARAGLLPMELLFRGGVAGKNLAFRLGVLRATRVPIPVISVGNLAVGGTGKTPISGWIVAGLRAAGHAPALVARGYGEDELALHRRWDPALPVIADPDRVAGVRLAMEAGAGVAVLDDGFQHRRLARDLDVVLLAAEHGLPRALLPRGRFREGTRALGRADLAVVTSKSAPAGAGEALAAVVQRAAPGVPVARVRFLPGDWTDLDGAPADAPLRARILTAVAGPAQVVATVEAAGVEVESLHAYPDHHAFTPGEFRDAARDGGTVVVTEKDAVKLAGLEVARGSEVRVLTQRIVFEEGERIFRERILEAAAGRGRAA